MLDDLATVDDGSYRQVVYAIEALADRRRQGEQLVRLVQPRHPHAEQLYETYLKERAAEQEPPL